MRTKKKFPVFYKIYFVFIALVVAGAAFGALWLHGYLQSYEDAQAYHVANAIFDEYYSSKDFNKIAEVTHDKDSFEGHDVVAKYFRNQYGDSEITYSSVSSGEEGILKYIVKAGDVKISSFTLKKTGEITEDGFDVYAKNTFELYYTPKESITVLVPEFSDVYLNDKVLDSSYVVEKDIIPEDYNRAPDGVEVVKYTKYTVDGLLQQPTLKVMSADIENEVVLNPETNEYEAALPNNVSLETEHEAFVIEAVKEYAKYMENDSTWGRVRPYFDPYTNLYESIRTVAQYYVHDHSSYRFDEEIAEEFYAYDDNTFSCRVKVLQVLENWGMEDYKDNIEMVVYLRRVGNRFLIFDWNVIGE